MSLTEQQLAERHTGLGGSDAAPALGLSPFKSPLELFLDKRERREPPAMLLAAMRWGTLLEPVIRQEYATVTKRLVGLPTGTLRHPKHAFMVAHLDGVTDDRRVFEAKTAARADGWGKPGTDEVPHHYMLQVQHYLAVTGLLVADIAVLIGGNDFRIYEVPADAELQQLIIEGEAQFWRLVETATPPPVDWDRDDAGELLKRLYPGTDGRTLTASESDESYRAAFEDALAKAKSYQKIADGAKQHLLYRMGESSRLVFEGGIQLTRKLTTRKGYVVEPSTFVDSRFSKLKETDELRDQPAR